MKSKLTKLFVEFFESEQASGVTLIACTILSILVANSWFGKSFIEFWHMEIGFDLGSILLKYSIEHWINDGLMAVFFLLIGLEIERELYVGELSNIKNASLPIFAAIGGMAVPALLYFLINRGTETARGIGIPMATDIAFALGVLALLGSKVPASLKVFLTAVAIMDDLGAIIMIALFYVKDFSLLYLLLALAIFAGLIIFNRVGISNLYFYLIPGVVMWYFMIQSGVHATLAGVLLAFAIPFASGDEKSPSYRLQHFLHKPVAYIIMPLFAFANTGIVLNSNWITSLKTPNAIGIITGLLIGKPLGIFLSSFLAVKLRVSQLPEGTSWMHIFGAGILGGIGFTMSIFITLLAFNNSEIIQTSKTAILLSSTAAGLIGYLVFTYGSNNRLTLSNGSQDIKHKD